jgi:hypothetical protein
VEHLTRVLDAEVVQARHVRDLSRDALSRSLEKEAQVHCRDV